MKTASWGGFSFPGEIVLSTVGGTMLQTSPMHDPHYQDFARRCQFILATQISEECAHRILEHLLQRHQLTGKAGLKTDYSGRSIEFTVEISGEVISGRLS